MATYYVGAGGNNASAGTSWATRWLTVAKALGASGIASGDTLYLAPGTYRETVTVAMTSAVAETFILGDVDGSHTSGIPGPVVWTAYTTNDKTIPAAAHTLDLSGRDHLTFRNLVFAQGQFKAVNASTATSTDISFTDCAFLGGYNFANDVLVLAAAGNPTPLNWTFDRCVFFAPGYNGDGWACNFQATNAASGSDYDLNVIVRNSMFIGGAGVATINVSASGANTTSKGNGVRVRNCTFIGSAAIKVTGTTTLSATFPSSIVNSIIYSGGTTGISSSSTTLLTEDYNHIVAVTARSNVTAGTHSQTTAYAPLLDVGLSNVIGQSVRPFGTPLAGSPQLGFGDDGNASAYDLLNRPRPEGGASTSKAIGALERHDSAVKETTVTDAGGAGLNITGPGSQRLLVAVNAASTTISVKARYDTNHGTTNKPQAILRANGEIAVATETKTMTAAVDTWETLTFTAFTPSAKGVVVIDLISRSAAGNGIAYFDTVTVS